MPFLLDTDICIFAIKQQAKVFKQLLSRNRDEIFVSAITEAELRTGAAKSASPRPRKQFLN